MTLQKLVVFELAFPDANGIRGRLWGGFVEALGRLWEALGGFGEALGGFGDARRPPPNKTIYKNVGSTQTPDKPALLAQC